MYSRPDSGLGSQVSLCDMPPHRKIWMTDLALASEVACLAARVLAAVAPCLPAVAPPGGRRGELGGQRLRGEIAGDRQGGRAVIPRQSLAPRNPRRFVVVLFHDGFSLFDP